MTTEILNAPPQILRLKDLKNITKLSGSTIYAEMKAGRFPKNFPLTSKRCVGWNAQEVSDFIQAKIDESRNVNGGA